MGDTTDLTVYLPTSYLANYSAVFSRYGTTFKTDGTQSNRNTVANSTMCYNQTVSTFHVRNITENNSTHDLWITIGY